MFYATAVSDAGSQPPCTSVADDWQSGETVSVAIVSVIVGGILVVSVLVDLFNTLVSTHTSNHRWWLSRRVSLIGWAILTHIAARAPEGRVREAIFGLFPPVLIFILMVVWVFQQILGYALIWWGIGGLAGVDTFADHIYYSGVVFFTVGFGEVVPSEIVPRFGAIVEAFSGVITMALVIGYLPSLYSAYSERERRLMTLDAGTEERIEPTDLVIAWSPNADVSRLLPHFAEWEDWVAGVLETHTSFPMLMLFRSHHWGQSWITALGLVSDSALQAEIIVGARGDTPYWMLRRSIRLLQGLTRDVDLSDYRRQLDTGYTGDKVFAELYARLQNHGFELYPYEEARAHTLELRRSFDAQLEYMIDFLGAPRGFWGHVIGHTVHNGSDGSSVSR